MSLTNKEVSQAFGFGAPGVEVGFSFEEDGTLKIDTWGDTSDPPTLAKITEWSVAAQLAVTRADAHANVLGLLAETDGWAARAVEEAVSMRPERIAYRKALRVKLGEIATSSTPADVVLPVPPA